MIERDDKTLPTEPPTQRRSISMHENVEVWEDCCVCEAEPYWIEAMEQDEPEESS